MPRNQDGRDREAGSLRRSLRSRRERARLESEQQPAEQVDQALWEQTATVGRQLGPGFEPDESDPGTGRGRWADPAHGSGQGAAALSAGTAVDCLG